jgi:transposase
VHGKISGKRYMRTSIVAARDREHKFVAPLLFEGMADTLLIIYWVKELLLKSLPANSILIWDNASFHKSKELKQLVEKAGHTMLFLPPYSPDLNPIEHKWFELKENLKGFWDDNLDFMGNLIKQVNLMSRC